MQHGQSCIVPRLSSDWSSDLGSDRGFAGIRLALLCEACEIVAVSICVRIVILLRGRRGAVDDGSLFISSLDDLFGHERMSFRSGFVPRSLALALSDVLVGAVDLAPAISSCF